MTFREEFIFRGKVTAGRRTSAGPTSSCTRWRTCGSATWSPWSGGTTCGSRSPSRTSWARFALVGGHPLHATAGSPSPTAARPGRTAPTSCPPPTRSPPTSATWRTPSSTSTASPTPRAPRCSSSSSRTSARTLPGGRAALLQAARVRQHPPGRPAVGRWRRPPAATWRLVAGLAADRRASTPSPRRSPTTRAAGSPSSPCSRRPPSRTPNCARTGSRSACTGATAGRRAGALRACRGGRRRARARSVAELAGAERPDLVLVNDDDLTYCKIRFDEGSLATLRGAARRAHRPAGPRAVLVGAVEPDPDGLMPARDFIDLVLRFAGARDRHRRAADAARAGRSPRCTTTRRRTGATTGGAAARRGRADASCGCAEPGSGHQLAWARFFASVAAGDGRPAAAARACWTARRGSTGWTWTRSCAGRSWSRWPRTASPTRRRSPPSWPATTPPPASATRCAAWPPGPPPRSRRRRGPRSWSPTRCPTPWWRRRSPASPSRAQRELLAPYAPRVLRGDRAGLAGAVDRDRRWTSCGGCSRPPEDARRRWRRRTPGWTAHPDAAPALRRLVLEARDDLARALRGAARAAAGGRARMPTAPSGHDRGQAP